MPAEDRSPITSPKNPRVRAAAALRDRSAREAAGRTLIDGVRELDRALSGGAVVDTVFVDPDRVGDDVEARAVVDRARATGASIVEAASAVLDRLAYGDRSEGLVAVVVIPDTSLGGVHLPKNALVVVLEGVEKPGNLGAVLRSADAASADAVVVADARTDLFNPNAIRASLGTIFAVPVATGSSAEVRAWLDMYGVQVLAARVGARHAYTDVDMTGPVALVLGAEAQGLTDAWSGDAITPISLPMRGVADSLNVSITAAVLLYEARRQRG
ncbi:MAG TPA: TrmH family RNA methyltransferase [Candidatus Limnocylindrales bacterium]|jgi:TrmH family RNA methyltransferase|nr:TrmH family RNA methyltransferase [Candidatus Limnocylindrales bacterium]